MVRNESYPAGPGRVSDGRRFYWTQHTVNHK